MKKVKHHFLIIIFFCLLGCAQNPKKISILGDSYSTFEGYVYPETNMLWYFKNPRNGTDVNSVEQLWWYRFIQDHNDQLEVNNSFSGSTICNTGYNRMDFSCCSFTARMDNLGDPDIIFIFGATNDAWAGSPLGEFQYANWTKASLYQFRPAMAYMLDYMLNHYSKTKIYFILNTELSDAIDASVKTICAHYKIDCIELKNIDKIAGHPSVKGMEQINQQISAFIDNQ
ncbi:SGNH/GDSL hydrolase family protein [Gaetbulibacter aestuarii]|uniref:SGNH/GDSL hydrolase family protein n=1 Tax=Gaetbulibacter aestuarii TaxID=1502358 RepID=A0ABW7N1J0_9FLAO